MSNRNDAVSDEPGDIYPVPALKRYRLTRDNAARAHRIHSLLPAMTQIFSLNCLVEGDNVDKMFTVEVLKTKNISILKELIKEKNPSSFRDVDFKIGDALIQHP